MFVVCALLLFALPRFNNKQLNLQLCVPKFIHPSLSTTRHKASKVSPVDDWLTILATRQSKVSDIHLPAVKGVQQYSAEADPSLL